MFLYKQISALLGHVDRHGHWIRRFHATRNVDVVAVDVPHPLASTDDSSNTLSTVHTYADLDGHNVPLCIVVIHDVDHVLCEAQCVQCVVLRHIWCPTQCKVRIANGFNLSMPYMSKQRSKAL